jgi:hypothetical protein
MKKKIIKQIFDVLRAYGIPVEEYEIKLTKEDDPPWYYMEMVHRTTKVRIEVSDIICDKAGNVLQSGKPDLR